MYEEFDARGEDERSSLVEVHDLPIPQGDRRDDMYLT